MPTVAVDQVFTALADATRRHLLEMLAEQGAASASAIAAKLPISRQAIAKHLAILEGAGLVSRLKVGKEVCFQVETHQLAATGRWMQRIAARWDSSISPSAVADVTLASGAQQLSHTIQ